MRKFRMVAPVLAVGAWVFAAERLLAQPSADPAAARAAESWLALVDSGHYADSWTQAASLFRAKITAAQWEKAVRSAREPLGKLVSRKLVSAQFTRTLPGAPDGEYVVLRYDTAFENKKSSVETVTPMKDSDGAWRVSGYYIQ
jgi:hypothetical protein